MIVLILFSKYESATDLLTKDNEDKASRGGTAQDSQLDQRSIRRYARRPVGRKHAANGDMQQAWRRGGVARNGAVFSCSAAAM